jgi:REP element-mobilizing transposase RayT
MQPPPRRKNLRLRSFDYSQAGAYFVTICTQENRCIFGSASDGIMHLNAAGEMVERWWLELNSKYDHIQTGQHIIMPNHIHGIITIVGAALCGCPEASMQQPAVIGQEGHPHRGAPTLGDIIGWYKTMSTNEYIRHVKTDHWPPFPRRLWQRNYYEHVIRHSQDLDSVRTYIDRNPLRWSLEENGATSYAT